STFVPALARLQPTSCEASRSALKWRITFTRSSQFISIPPKSSKALAAQWPGPFFRARRGGNENRSASTWCWCRFESMWCDGTRGEPDGVLPAAGVGQEEAEEELVLGMGVDGVEPEHGTLGAAACPRWTPRESYPSSRWLVNENRCWNSDA